MIKLIPKESFLNEAKHAKNKPNLVLQILIFIVVFIATGVGSSIPVFIALTMQAFSKGINYFNNFEEYNKYITDITNSRVTMIVMLFATAITTFLVIIYCRCIEKRSFKSMGFIRKNAVLQYIIGIIVGLLMFSACVFICVVQGSLKYEGIVVQGSLLFIILFFFGFLFQGMSEEVLLRSYFMVSLSNKIPIVAAIMLNSTVFAMLHLSNSGISVLAFINLILFGVFASVYAIKTNNIWGICAIHSIWNFAQGNLYGILVSGMDTNASVFKFTAIDNGELFNGGEFGLEGGLAVTIVLILSTILTLLLVNNKDKANKEK